LALAPTVVISNHLAGRLLPIRGHGMIAIRIGLNVSLVGIFALVHTAGVAAARQLDQGPSAMRSPLLLLATFFALGIWGASYASAEGRALPGRAALCLGI